MKIRVTKLCHVIGVEVIIQAWMPKEESFCSERIIYVMDELLKFFMITK